MAPLDVLLIQHPFPAALFDPDKKLLRYNPPFCKLSGYPRQYLDSMPAFPEVFAPVQPFKESYDLSSQDDSAVVDKLCVVSNGKGDRLRLEIHEIVLPANDDGAVLTFVTLIDKSTFVALEEENYHLARLSSLGKMHSFIIHEINNIIGIIHGCAELISIRDTIDESFKRDVGTIKKETRAATKILSSALGFVSKGHFMLERFSVDELVADVLELKNLSLKRKKISCLIDIEKGFKPHVIGDRTLLMLAMVNLIENAEESFRDGQEKKMITLRVTKARGEVNIEISNNGPAIPRELHEKIFTPFYTTKKHAGGTGLGLSFSQRILKRYGGSLTLKNSAPGSETVFQILLPEIWSTSEPDSDATGEDESLGLGI